jgi:hypothetical protein
MGAVAALDEKSASKTPAYVMRFQPPRLAAAKTALDPAEFNCFWKEGHEMDIDVAVNYALGQALPALDGRKAWREEQLSTEIRSHRLAAPAPLDAE